MQAFSNAAGQFPQQPSNRPGIDRPLTISEINGAIRVRLEQSFHEVWLEGELNDITIHPSTHVYFTLKDANSQLKGVAFKYAPTARQLDLKRGMAVEVRGSIGVYEPRGEYQIYAHHLIPKGAGELNRQLEELRLRLNAEGLFDPAKKRPIPTLPSIIGLITAGTGAAIQDFLKNLNCPIGGMHVRFIPASVQGPGAPQQIINAINYFNQNNACDVIVVTRGGGGIEDLVAFNDEMLVRTIAYSQIPVLVAVGHDRDLSLCDFAADASVSTPTAAANLVVKGKIELCNRLTQAAERMKYLQQTRFFMLKQRFERAAACRFLNFPLEWTNRLAQRLDYASGKLASLLPNMALQQNAKLEKLSVRLKHAPVQALAIRQQRLQQAKARLDAIAPALLAHPKHRLERCDAMLKTLDPKGVLQRGYAILLDKNQKAVRSAEDAKPGEQLRALVAQGEIKLIVADENR